MRADLSAHVLADHCRESVVEARSDTGGSDLIRTGVEVRPAMGHAWCGCAGHRHLRNIVGAEHGFDCARKSRADDAMSTGVFWVHRRAVTGMPSGLTFGRSVAVEVALADGGDRAPEGVLVLGVHDGDHGVR